MKQLFIDTETGGTDSRAHAMLQVAGIIVIDGLEKERFDLKMQAVPGKTVLPEALGVQGVKDEDLASRMHGVAALGAFKAILARYVDKFNKADKFMVYGWNVAFDDEFLRAWFSDCGDKYYGSWFWWPAIDVAGLVSHRMGSTRMALPSFKLGAVAEHLGIKPEGDLHDALTDIDLTRKILLRMENGNQPPQ